MMEADMKEIRESGENTDGRRACPKCGGTKFTRVLTVHESGVHSDSGFIAERELLRETESMFCSNCLSLH